MSCIFCKIHPQKIIMENDYFFVIPDKYPVSRGHHLIISKRHITDFFELNASEAPALLEISKRLKDYLGQELNPSGYNLAMNSGKSAGQTIFHFHLHFIPRY
nr:hypothetical protein [Candidatus Cloacimonadota bacterium]